ncbi:MAG: hypothetical protein EZS28_018248 [Streblomastix strix]|uniref:Uncharacterized protein n=1 Tax=Streblomastix strix TaxID=222440 RepID=A0A5J4VUS9_9EUKA|nr:MAG: hypothetical protein EZS28_018248 [Streblomastix strix]
MNIIEGSEMVFQTQDEDENHHLHKDHDHGKKCRRVNLCEGSGNQQNNDDWAEGLKREVERQQLRQFRKQRNVREQAISPVQTVTEALVYMSNLRKAQKEAFHRRNDIFPNLEEENSVSWTNSESINQKLDIPFADFLNAEQQFAEQENQQLLNGCKSGTDYLTDHREHSKE